MKKIFFGLIAVICLFASCRRPSAVERYRAEKHIQDSVALTEQERSLAYYQGQLETVTPQADSLLPLFQYERNEKYQGHGYYVVKNAKLKVKSYNLRVLVRDDGREVLVYKEGKRLSNEQMHELRETGNEALARAEHLQVVIRDIRELEKRIARTSLEVQKYQKRLEND